MAATQNQLQFHAGLQGGSSYFFVNQDGHTNKDARVTMTTIGIIKKRIEHREKTGSPVVDLEDFLVTFLPITFMAHLNAGGIGLVDAWKKMTGKSGSGSGSRLGRQKAPEQVYREEAERLARILATAAGGRKSANEIVKELAVLMAMHLDRATKILQGWADMNGYSKKGGYVIVDNRANKKKRKSAAQAP